MAENKDMVKEPSHYNTEIEGKMETIDIISSILLNPNYTAREGLYLGNHIKYIDRAGVKVPTDEGFIQDIEKSLTYYLWFIDDIERRFNVDILNKILTDRKIVGTERRKTNGKQ